MKYTKEYLEELAKGDLIYPQSLEVYNDMSREVLRDIMDDPVRASEVEDYISMGDLMPFDYASDLCVIIGELAELLLEERQERQELFEDLKRTLQDSIDEINQQLSLQLK
jgi:hypothetical protein